MSFPELTAWSTEPDELAEASVDRSGAVPDGVPDLVVYARSVADVQHTVAYAASHGVPVVPRGAGSGVAGGAVAGAGSIGGNIATNAGGLRCVNYGVTRDAVLAVDAVLGDGTLVSTGRRTLKGVTGYDLTGLLVGSEGRSGSSSAPPCACPRRRPRRPRPARSSPPSMTRSWP